MKPRRGYELFDLAKAGVLPAQARAALVDLGSDAVFSCTNLDEAEWLSLWCSVEGARAWWRDSAQYALASRCPSAECTSVVLDLVEGCKRNRRNPLLAAAVSGADGSLSQRIIDLMSGPDILGKTIRIVAYDDTAPAAVRTVAVRSIGFEDRIRFVLNTCADSDTAVDLLLGHKMRRSTHALALLGALSVLRPDLRRVLSVAVVGREVSSSKWSASMELLLRVGLSTWCEDPTQVDVLCRLAQNVPTGSGVQLMLMRMLTDPSVPGPVAVQLAAAISTVDVYTDIRSEVGFPPDDPVVLKASSRLPTVFGWLLAGRLCTQDLGDLSFDGDPAFSVDPVNFYEQLRSFQAGVPLPMVRDQDEVYELAQKRDSQQASVIRWEPVLAAAGDRREAWRLAFEMFDGVPSNQVLADLISVM